LGGQWGYGSVSGADARDRAAAIGAVILLHAGVVGLFVIAQLNRPKPPPERVLTVSFISEAASAAAAPAAAPPPPPPPPERTLLATPRPTDSPMTAPPPDPTPPPRPVEAQPAPPAPIPAPPAPSIAPIATLGASSANASAEAAVTPPNFTAAYLNNPGPQYPIASRRRREQGIVRLRVQVSAEGAVQQVLLDRTSGHPDLDAAALDVVRKRWRFAPAKQGDRPVAAWVIVPLDFALKDR
jgi:protein TonB